MLCPQNKNHYLAVATISAYSSGRRDPLMPRASVRCSPIRYEIREPLKEYEILNGEHCRVSPYHVKVMWPIERLVEVYVIVGLAFSTVSGPEFS
jgi:hypothetical protein